MYAARGTCATEKLCCRECLFYKIDQLSRLPNHQVRCDRVEALADWFDCHCCFLLCELFVRGTSCWRIFSLLATSFSGSYDSKSARRASLEIIVAGDGAVRLVKI